MKRVSRRASRSAYAVLVLIIATAGGCATPASSGPPGDVPKAGLDASLHDRLPPAIQESGILRIGTDASYAPMSSFGPDGRTIIGVEPEIGAALGRVLGVRVTFVTADFTTVLPSVARGEFDLGMSAITDTPDRARKVDFVNYFSAGTSILVQRGNPAGITDIQDLCGRTVAVETGTTQVDLLARSQGNCPGRRITVTTYPTNSDALVQLRTGRAHAVLNDLPPAIHLVNDPRTRVYYQLASTTQYEPGLYGIAVDKGEPTLRDAVQGACEQLIKAGVYSRILAEWGVSEGAIARVSINSDR